MGLHHDDFWLVTLREYDLIIKGRVEARQQDHRAMQCLNQELGVLVHYAFHDPKNMPDFTQANEAKKPPSTNRSHDLEKLRAGLMALHFHGKGRK